MAEMKTRRHHNNQGLRQIKRGRTAQQMQRLADKLGVPFCVGKDKTRPRPAKRQEGAF